MRETRQRKTTAISTETNRFERGRGSSRRSRLQEMDFAYSGHPGNSGVGPHIWQCLYLS